MRRAKIVCTLGPASDTPHMIEALVRAGMDVARLNTSHGTIEGHLQTCRHVRDVSKTTGKPVGVILDLGGPKLRTGRLGPEGPVTLERGAIVTVSNTDRPTTATEISIDYPSLQDDVAVDDPILLNDGAIELMVRQRTAKGLRCEVIYGGVLGENRGVSLPSSDLSLPSLTERDLEAIEAGVRAEVDFFALSFVKRASDVIETRERINACGGDIPIIAKIERRQAVDHLDEIMAEADGAMVARGDLGVDLPPEDVPLQQRRIIASAALHKVPVITATQMLESMVDTARPTRAEASDVANAVWDMSDALMLSQETAIGRYPIESVAMMDRIIRRAESAPVDGGPAQVSASADDHSYVLALAARRIVESDPNMRAVICFTNSGYTAVLMSKVHPNAPIYALSPHHPVVRRLALARGVVPIQTREAENTDEIFDLVDETLVGCGAVAPGDEVLVVAGMPVGITGTTNFVKLHQVGARR